MMEPTKGEMVMLIRDLEIKTGLDRATIRYYEKEGLITPERKENGYRDYTDENLNTLMKIKLLRQIGMTLDRIKALQQGSADLQTALSEQLRILEQRIRDTQQARVICQQMQLDRVSYADLDAGEYLRALSAPQTVPVNSSFKERVYREYHPVRRFLARWADYCLAGNLLHFLFVVVLGVRPYSDLLSGAVTFLVPFLMVPLGAWMLHKWGTTPGKWCLGLRVESEDGGNLTFSSALQREWDVLRYGYGFGIPVWIYWRLYKSYREYQQREPDWDWDAEYCYQPQTFRRNTAAAGLLVSVVLLIIVTTGHQFQAKHKDNLTVADFSANYNQYKTLLFADRNALRRLQPDGTFYLESGTSATLYIDGTPEKEKYSFDYVTEGELLREIHYSNRWNQIFYMDPIGIHCDIAAISSVMSQDGMTLMDLKEFLKIWETESAQDNGEVRYGSVRIYWAIEAENCNRSEDGHYYSNDEDAEDSSVSLDFVIELPG